MNPLGSLIRNERQKKGMGLRELAREIGTTASYISKIEKGDIAKPSSDNLRQIFTILEIEKNVMNNDIHLDDRDTIVRENITNELGKMDSEQLEAVSLMMFKYRDIMLSLYAIEKSGERVPMTVFREMGDFFKNKYVKK